VPLNRNNGGFTLIEVIASLVILGIIVAITGLGLVEGIRSYLFTRMTADTVQQAQFALARMRLEFVNMETPSAGNIDSITFRSDNTRRSAVGSGYLNQGYDTPGTTYQFSRTGTQINLTRRASGGSAETQPLITGLGPYGTNAAADAFLGYTVNTATSPSGSLPGDFRDLKLITVRLIMNRTDENGTLTFVTAVNPRNNGLANCPESIPGGQ